MISLEAIKENYLAGDSIPDVAMRLGITYAQARWRILKLGIMRKPGTIGHTRRPTLSGLGVSERVRTPTGREGVILRYLDYDRVQVQISPHVVATYRRADLVPTRPPQGEHPQEEEL